MRFLLEWPRNVIGGTLAAVGLVLTLVGEVFVRLSAWVLDVTFDEPDDIDWSDFA